MAKGSGERHIGLGDFQRLAVSQIKRSLILARQDAERAAGDYISRDEALIIRRFTLQQAINDTQEVANDLKARFPSLGTLVDDIGLALQAIATAADTQALLASFLAAMARFGIADDPDPAHAFALDAAASEVVLTPCGIADDPAGLSLASLEDAHDDQAFLRATANRIAAARRAKQALSRHDLAAVSAAYRLLDRGVSLPPDYQSIGTAGFRRHQTRLSLADPGDGHRDVTCADDRLLDGVIVHVEHIDRGGNEDREVVEAYRLPAAINAARVRLHAGSAAPCTAYVGRPLFENGTSIRLRGAAPVYMPIAFPADLLKTVHYTASACTAMFVNGIADCKIAIERMAVSETLAFMTAVAGNVMRDPTRQFLSAAFNFNIAIWDDRGALPRLVSDPFEIAMLAIELTLAGQFDKVTWDRASNKVPSESVLEQLSHGQWTTLIHLAHEQGLETYVSAGLKAKDMADCVAIGVDGVGIGTSLHFTAPQKPMGQLKPRAILDALRVRDAAEIGPLGRGARLLARLDRRFFEMTLPADREADRLRLFEALRDQREGELATLLEKLEPLEFPDGAGALAARDTAHPVLAQAKRVLASSTTESIGALTLGSACWKAKLATIDRLITANDVIGLREAMRP